MAKYYDSSEECYKEIPSAPYYVCSNDSFMSNWGPSRNKINTCVVPCESYKQAQAVLEYVESRKDQKRIRITSSKPRTKSHVVYSLTTGWLKQAELKEKSYKFHKGLYKFSAPPVCTSGWDDHDWIKWIDNHGEWS